MFGCSECGYQQADQSLRCGVICLNVLSQVICTSLLIYAKRLKDTHVVFFLPQSPFGLKYTALSSSRSSIMNARNTTGRIVLDLDKEL